MTSPHTLFCGLLGTAVSQSGYCHVSLGSAEAPRDSLVLICSWD